MTATNQNQTTSFREDGAQPSLWAGVLFSAAVFTVVDETVLHLILHWHHFYDKSSPSVALMADGLFQAVGLLAFAGGVYLTADLRRRSVLRPQWQSAGFFLGLGLIGLFDEVVVHKVLRFHQIHYGPEVWKYDAAAGVCIAASLLVGSVLLARVVRHRDDPAL